MKRRESSLEIILRVFIATMFIFSGISKLDPIHGFEKQLVDMGIASWSWVPYLSRFIIGIEIFIGCALIDKFWLKKVTLPATAAMLLAFCVHLTWLGFRYDFFDGNCGCFGDKLPMTPLEAIGKNLVTIAALYFLWTKAEKEKRRMPTTLVVALFGVFFWLFLMYTPKSYERSTNTTWESGNGNVAPIENSENTSNSDSVSAVDSISIEDTTTRTEEAINTTTNNTNTETLNNAENNVSETIIPDNTTAVSTPVSSKFAQFNSFNGRTVNLDDGEKLVCLFNVSCSHCKATAKDIFELKKQLSDIPDVYILFYGDEFFLDFFWDEVGGTFPYQFVEGEVFWPLLGDHDFPWVLHLEDGKTLKDWDLESYNKEGFEAYWVK